MKIVLAIFWDCRVILGVVDNILDKSQLLICLFTPL